MTSTLTEKPGKKKLLGKTEPRLWTRPLRPLNEETSLGYEAIEFSEDLLGRPLHPWQKWFLIHSLELAPGSFVSDEYPVLRFKTVVLMVARQNGKSYLMSTRLLWRMIMWRGPEIDDPLVLGSANKLPTAKEILELSYKALVRSPKLKDEVDHMSNTNGQEQIRLRNGSRYKIEAASDDGGRGLSVLDLGFDELRQQKDWAPWSALTNTTNARHSSQIIGVSNAGEAKSDVLRSLRQRGIDELDRWKSYMKSGGDPEAWKDQNPNGYATLGLFEYSAPDDCDIWDREGWAYANPSMGHTNGPTEDTIAAAASLVGTAGKGMPEHKFRTEILCQWVNAAVEGPFSQDEIDQCTDPDSEIDPASPIVVSADVSADRGMSYVAVAGFREDGDPHIEIIAQRAYTEWLPDYLENKLTFPPRAIVVQGKGAPISSLIEFFEKRGIEITTCEGSALPASCGQLADRVTQGTVHWRDQSILLNALKEAVKKHYGDVWSWNRDKSPVDVAPLCAATFALWGLYNAGEATRKKTAYSEDYGRWWE